MTSSDISGTRGRPTPTSSARGALDLLTRLGGHAVRPGPSRGTHECFTKLDAGPGDRSPAAVDRQALFCREIQADRTRRAEAEAR
ncbi:hypothetical protein ACFYM0_37030 [Streptomyces sp. NPDC006487]|uniref:hypothetical protein n=1 Tax=Streptomyces sp. NPDC006487 TaxID=3364748 RepID=UPI0036BDB767